jgi:hypothetical protein
VGSIPAIHKAEHDGEKTGGRLLGKVIRKTSKRKDSEDEGRTGGKSIFYNPDDSSRSRVAKSAFHSILYSLHFVHARQDTTIPNTATVLCPLGIGFVRFSTKIS